MSTGIDNVTDRQSNNSVRKRFETQSKELAKERAKQVVGMVDTVKDRPALRADEPPGCKGDHRICLIQSGRL
jgi:hypothetical protein